MDAIVEQNIKSAVRSIRDAGSRFDAINVFDVPVPVANAIIVCLTDLLHAVDSIAAIRRRLDDTCPSCGFSDNNGPACADLWHARRHTFVGRHDRACEVCSRPDRHPIHKTVQ